MSVNGAEAVKLLPVILMTGFTPPELWIGAAPVTPETPPEPLAKQAWVKRLKIPDAQVGSQMTGEFPANATVLTKKVSIARILIFIIDVAFSTVCGP